MWHLTMAAKAHSMMLHDSCSPHNPILTSMITNMPLRHRAWRCARACCALSTSAPHLLRLLELGWVHVPPSFHTLASDDARGSRQGSHDCAKHVPFTCACTAAVHHRHKVPSHGLSVKHLFSLPVLLHKNTRRSGWTFCDPKWADLCDPRRLSSKSTGGPNS